MYEQPDENRRQRAQHRHHQPDQGSKPVGAQAHPDCERHGERGQSPARVCERDGGQHQLEHQCARESLADRARGVDGEGECRRRAQRNEQGQCVPVAERLLEAGQRPRLVEREHARYVEPGKQLLPERVDRDQGRDRYEAPGDQLGAPAQRRADRGSEANGKNVREDSIEFDPALVGRDAPQDAEGAPDRERGQERHSGDRDPGHAQADRPQPEGAEGDDSRERRHRNLHARVVGSAHGAVGKRGVEDHRAGSRRRRRPRPSRSCESTLRQPAGATSGGRA